MRSLTARVAASLVAIGLVALAYFLPLWKMTLDAPQYPESLRLRAYGTRIEGDLREINIINHYIGMEPIDTIPAPEMGLFSYFLLGLGFLCALAPLHRRLRQLAILAIVVTAVVILGDLQLWLHDFGRNLKPAAPIRVEPFTPSAIGVSTIGNFRTMAMVSWGYFTLLGAALVLYLGGRARSGSACAVVLFASLPTPAGAEIQARIDATPRGGAVTIQGGAYQGPLVIRGPLTVVGVDWPIVDGGGSGSVVQIEGDGVVLRGFHLRGSGRHVSEEAAGIKVRGSGHLIESNRVENVYFGIHLSQGSGNVVRGNDIVPGERHGERPGHGVSLWYQERGLVASNRIAHARDGVYDLLLMGTLLTADLGPGLLVSLLLLNPVDAARILAVLALEPDLHLLGPAGAFLMGTVGIRGAALLLLASLVAWTAVPLLTALMMFRIPRARSLPAERENGETAPASAIPSTE